MDLEKLKSISGKIDKIYTNCMIKVISTAMEDKYGDNAYQEYEKIDEINHKLTRFPLIAKGKQSFDNFDIQACTKTLLHLKDVRTIIFDYYNIDKSKYLDKDNCSEELKTNLETLKAFRNKKSHESNSEKVTGSDLSNGIKAIDFIIEHLFPDLVDDETGKTYHSLIDAETFTYHQEKTNEKYLLKDYLSEDEYDYTRFHTVCHSINIGSKTENAEYYFYSSNLENTLEILKNNLRKKASSNNTQTPPEPEQPAAQQPVQQVQYVKPQPNLNKTTNNKKNHNIILLIIIILLVIVLAVVIGKSVGTNASDKTLSTSSYSANIPTDNQAAEPSSTTTTVPATSSTKQETPAAQTDTQSPTTKKSTQTTTKPSTTKKATQTTTKPSTTKKATQTTTKPTTTKKATQTTTKPTTTKKTTSSQTKGTNQIPAKYSAQVERAKKKPFGIIRIAVDEKDAPDVAWSEIEVYSENTAIAKIDKYGMIVGVSPGETYVLVKASTGSTVVYKVIVE